jgi:hypothetical protein
LYNNPMSAPVSDYPKDVNDDVPRYSPAQNIQNMINVESHGLGITMGPKVEVSTPIAAGTPAW